jgi:dTDP-4-dehydrorhamnose 3,5-epimerase
VPVGFAHGFCTLTDIADVQYQCSALYTPSAERNIAWNDPDLAIDWPDRNPILSKCDSNGMSLKQYLANPAFHYRP